MTALVVDAAARTVSGPFGRAPCLIGRGGACPAESKREGDGCTPLGSWPVRGALFRKDRLAPPPGFALPWRWIAPGDGWSDDPGDPAYNRPVRHPHPFSAERLWREDGVYDVVVVLGHNDRPAHPDRGSAIFLHLAGESTFTEGCVAVSRETMELLLATLRPGASLEIAQLREASPVPSED